METIGVENLKKLILFACDLTKQAASSFADGVQFRDTFSFLDEAIRIPGIAKTFPEIKAELADLSVDEKEELYAFLQDEFDLPEDKLEIAIENSIMQVASLVALYEMWRDLKSTE